MPDTGPPWNIPYVDPADIVRDYPQASEDLADAIAAGLSAAGNPGIGSNVVQTVKTDVFTTSSTSFVDLMTLAITPTTNTSKILISWSVNLSNTSGTSGTRGVITDGANNILLQGDGVGSRTRVTFGSRDSSKAEVISNWAGCYLWSPASDTAQTIKVRVAANATTLTVNRSGFFGDDVFEPLPVSMLTAIEVAP